MKRLPLCCIGPAAVVVLAILVGPFVLLAWQSLFDLNPFEGRDSFVGVGNYTRLIRDPVFRSSLGVSLRYALCAALVSVAVAMIIAALSYAGRARFRVLVLLLVPFLVAPTVVSLVFALGLDPQLGVVPRLLSRFGVAQPDNVIGDPVRVFWALVLIDAWQWFGVLAVVIYARVRQVPRRFFECVTMSGGGATARFLHVWIPAVIPTLGAILAFKFLWSLADAERIDALTAGGGPHGAMRVFSIWIERQYFRYADYGYGAAAAMVVYLIGLLALSGFIILLRKSKDFA